MIRAFLIIFDPIRTWDRIARARRTMPFVLCASVLPLLLFSCYIEGWGLATWGKWQGPIAHRQRFSHHEIIAYETVQFVTSLLLVFLGAKLLKSLGETFHGRHTYASAFTVIAYALGPLFLLRMLDAFPAMPLWVTWAIGIALSVGTLYQGIPRVMEPDPPHAFGLFLTSAFLLALTSGVLRFITAWWLQGKFKKIEVIILNLIAQFFPT